jgi:hypothetical protein
VRTLHCRHFLSWQHAKLLHAAVPQVQHEVKGGGAAARPHQLHGADGAVGDEKRRLGEGGEKAEKGGDSTECDNLCDLG